MALSRSEVVAAAAAAVVNGTLVLYVQLYIPAAAFACGGEVALRLVLRRLLPVQLQPAQVLF